MRSLCHSLIDTLTVSVFELGGTTLRLMSGALSVFELGGTKSVLRLAVHLCWCHFRHRRTRSRRRRTCRSPRCCLTSCTWRTESQWRTWAWAAAAAAAVERTRSRRRTTSKPPHCYLPPPYICRTERPHCTWPCGRVWRKRSRRQSPGTVARCCRSPCTCRRLCYCMPGSW